MTRDPTKPIDKLLYLVYAKDLLVKDHLNRTIELPKHKVTYHRDSLSLFFYNSVLEHAKLKWQEPGHTSACSCQIQLDLQPLAHQMTEKILAKLGIQA